MVEANKIYHFFNQGNNRELIFYQARNYQFFLDKAKHYLNPLCDILAYCLMPNHFHFLVYTRPKATIAISQGSVAMNKFSSSIQHLQSGYTKAINKQENRTGSLFRQRAKVKLVENTYNNYPFIAFHYIHQNPIKAELVGKMEDWPYSSFNEYWKNEIGVCNKELAREVIDFGNDDFYEQSYGVIY